MGSNILVSGIIEVDGRNESNYSKPRILFKKVVPILTFALIHIRSSNCDSTDNVL